MTTIWYNPMLSIDELSVWSCKGDAWLRDRIRDADDPIPSIKVGNTVQVLWSDYCEWSQRRYGNGAPLRGTEFHNVIIKKKTRRKVHEDTEDGDFGQQEA
jgi:hypothetical protein